VHIVKLTPSALVH